MAKNASALLIQQLVRILLIEVVSDCAKWRTDYTNQDLLLSNSLSIRTARIHKIKCRLRLLTTFFRTIGFDLNTHTQVLRIFCLRYHMKAGTLIQIVPHTLIQIVNELIGNISQECTKLLNLPILENGNSINELTRFSYSIVHLKVIQAQSSTH